MKRNFQNEGDTTISCIYNISRVLPTTTVTLKLRRRKWTVRMAVADLGKHDAMLSPAWTGRCRSRRGSERRRGATRDGPAQQSRRTRKRIRHPLTCISQETQRQRVAAERAALRQTAPRASGPNPHATQMGNRAPRQTATRMGSPTTEGDIRSRLKGTKSTQNNDKSSEGGGESSSSLSDQVFQKASTERIKKRVQRRLESQQYSQKWGMTINLDRGQDQMRELQRADGSLNEEFFWREEDGLLYRRGTLPGDEDIECRQLVLPTQYREHTLRMAHIAPLAGHFGNAKTTNRIKQRFFWPGMAGDVRELCKRCQTCQKTPPKYTPKAPLVPLPIIRTPFTRLAMDIVGPLPSTEEGHRYILTV